MQRGELKTEVAVMSVLALTGMAALATLFMKSPSGQVTQGEDIFRPSNNICSTLTCASNKEAYYLGTIGAQVRCCCPEHYNGNLNCRYEQRVALA